MTGDLIQDHVWGANRKAALHPAQTETHNHEKVIELKLEDLCPYLFQMGVDVELFSVKTASC